MPRKAIDPSERWYSDKEVQDFAHNVTIAISRWERLKHTLPKRVSAIRDLGQQLVLELRDIMSTDDTGHACDPIMTDDELAVACQVAVELLLFPAVHNQENTLRDIEKKRFKIK